LLAGLNRAPVAHQSHAVSEGPPKGESRMRKGVLAGILIAACAACGGSSADIEEIKKGQKDVLAKLESMEKALAARPAAAPARPTIDPNKVYNIPVENAHVRGPKGAPVTIVEFSDFQCPFCAQSATLIDQVMKEYPKDVNFVYKNFPLTQIHPQAMPAAKAALAAGKQNKFWEMHDIMFQNAKALGPDNLKDYAGKIGLDVARFEKDMNAPEIQAQVDKEMQEARAADVQGTPTIFVGGKRLQNRSVDGFKQMIEAALKEKGEKKG
jgi:protein-disulfide isomerase